MGRIVAFHLPARDLDRAAAFYAKVFGWELTRNDDSPTPYATDPAGTGRAVAGALVARTETVRQPVPVLAVDDVDAALAKLERLGGRAEPGVSGTFRYAQDSEGNILGLTQRDGVRLGPSETGVGRFLNLHLPVDDVIRATIFYSELLGWELRATPGDVPYIMTSLAQLDGPGLELAIVQREAIVKAPTPTIEVEWIDDAMTTLAMNEGQAAVVNDIADVGRFGYAKDSEGNTIAMLQRSFLLRS
ncbi:MAG: VOC family protein [Vulcanimicrobiaceae bacterium]